MQSSNYKWSFKKASKIIEPISAGERRCYWNLSVYSTGVSAQSQSMRCQAQREGFHLAHSEARTSVPTCILTFDGCLPALK